MTSVLRIAALLCLVGLLGGCAVGASTPGASPLGASPEPSIAAVPGSPSPAEAEAIRFRTSFGLEADIGYVRLVAADPLSSDADFAVPLLPAELAELNARAANADAVRDVIRAYAARHPDEFGGMYLDQATGGGAVTTLWTGHLEEHAAAIRALVRPDARIAFRPAQFTIRDLSVLQDRVVADWDWMRAIAIVPVGADVDVIGNHVEIDVSSANPAAAGLIVAHYDVRAGMIVVFSDGTGAELIPRGTVRGRVVDSLGKPPGDRLEGQLSLQWTSDGPGDCGGGDIGYGLASDGSFELPCQAGGHTISVQVDVPNSDYRTIGSGHVIAVGNATVTLMIKLAEPWPAPHPG